MSATDESAVAMSVVFHSFGPKTSFNGSTLAVSALTEACHFSDSGTKRRKPNVSKAGAAPMSATQRHESTVTLKKIANTAINAKPTLAAAPITPAMSGRCLAGQTSITSAMPSDHSPPMPSAAIKRAAHRCHGSWAK